MSRIFSRTFHARWGDMDFNGHMRNTAYLDVAADVRMLYFESKGFSMREFERLRLGPVILRDELTYHRELRLLQEFTVTMVLSGMSEDGVRFVLVNDVLGEGGALVAKVTSDGGWMSLDARKLTAPPEDLARAMNDIVRTDDFQVLRRSSKG